MAELLVFFLFALGLIYLITEAAITAPFRMLFARGRLLKTFLYCASCVGFWVGGGISFHPRAPRFVSDDVWFNAFISACVVMAVANLWAAYKGGNPAYTHEQSDDRT